MLEDEYHRRGTDAVPSDQDRLEDIANDRAVQITIHRSSGEFLVPGDIILSVSPPPDQDADLEELLHDCVTQGSNRTDMQDVLLLSDQLVEVLGRALSPRINDPNTAMLCLSWISAGLMAFVGRTPPDEAQQDDPVLYRRVQFEDMLERSFDQMRQYVATDRSVTLHAIAILGKLAQAVDRANLRDVCLCQVERLRTSALQVQGESVAKDEIKAAECRVVDQATY